MADLDYMWQAWGDVYAIFPPSADCLRWRAVAQFGAGDVLLAGSSDDLLDKIRSHYPVWKQGRVRDQ